MTTDRSNHGRAHPADVDVLRAAFDSGRAIARGEVWERYRIGDRRFRAAVTVLRLSGLPVIAESSEGSTYRLARTTGELEAFLGELRSRARSLEEQIRALEAHAPAHFGQAEQLAIAI